MFKKVSWKVEVYSHLSGYLIGHRRDSAARRVVSDTDTPKSSPKELPDKMYATGVEMCIFMPKVSGFVLAFDIYAYQFELFS